MSMQTIETLSQRVIELVCIQINIPKYRPPQAEDVADNFRSGRGGGGVQRDSYINRIVFCLS